MTISVLSPFLRLRNAIITALSSVQSSATSASASLTGATWTALMRFPTVAAPTDQRFIILVLYPFITTQPKGLVVVQ